MSKRKQLFLFIPHPSSLIPSLVHPVNFFPGIPNALEFVVLRVWYLVCSHWLFYRAEIKSPRLLCESGPVSWWHTERFEYISLLVYKLPIQSTEHFFRPNFQLPQDVCSNCGGNPYPTPTRQTTPGNERPPRACLKTPPRPPPRRPKFSSPAQPEVQH